MVRLILVTAEGGQQALDLRAVNSLGRHPNNSIQLLDKIVSKEHSVIEQRGAEFVLRDLGSLNGTYIYGERVRGARAVRRRKRPPHVARVPASFTRLAIAARRNHEPESARRRASDPAHRTSTG